MRTMDYGDRQKFTPAQDMKSNLANRRRSGGCSGEPFVDYRAGDPLVDRIGIYGGYGRSGIATR